MSEQHVGQIITLSPYLIHVKDRVRSDMGDVADLAADIKENGLVNPITVRPPTPEEKDAIKEPYVLVAGGRRLAAHVMLGKQTIPCYVRESMNELKHRIIELNENVKRKQMTWDEECLANEEIMRVRQEIAAMEGKQITQGEVAAELGVSAGTFSRSLKAAEALKKSPELKKAGSRKAAIRASEMAEYNKRRVTLSEVLEEQHGRLVERLQKNVVSGDSRDWIRRVPERTVDLILTDPPFGINYFSAGHKTKPGERVRGLGVYNDTEEEARDFLTDIVPHWFRVLRETGWLVCFMNRSGYDFLENLVMNCCAEHFDYRWNPADNDEELMAPGELRRNRNRCAVAVAEDSPNACRFLKPEPLPWIWVRKNSRNKSRYPEIHAQNVYETILVCNMGHARLTHDCQNVIDCDADYGEDRIHPHQKPIPLAAILTTRFTDLGCTVMDTTYGSGALLAGAASKGRVVMGCELNDAMRGPAIGLISKHAIPASANSLKQSEERYYRLMNKSLEGVHDFEEVEGSILDESEIEEEIAEEFVGEMEA